jgi:hypothetical protein
MAPAVDINYLAVLVAAIAAMAIGFLWYGPLFGKEWARLMGFGKLSKKELENMKAKGKKAMPFQFAASLIMSYILAHFVDYTQAATFMDGAVAGTWLWLGFIATVQIGSVLWEGKPVKLYAINTLHYLVALIVMGGILAVWV